MSAPALLHELVLNSAGKRPAAVALNAGDRSATYAELSDGITRFVAGLRHLGVDRADRVAIYLDKRIETAVASFGATAAGGVFVPINPLLKGAQVGYILRDCNVRVLVTSPERLFALRDHLRECHDLRHVVLVGAAKSEAISGPPEVHAWEDVLSAPTAPGHRVVDIDMAGILYTSGSTGQPKGVVLSHRNLVAGAVSVASYIENTPDDVILSALPLSFDAGFSQLTSGFLVGARVVLLNYVLPKDLLTTMDRERVTGLTAVPPLWIQLTQLNWPEGVARHLRYFANTGGHMPRETLKALRARVPSAKPFLMYGLTEAFRATYLPPALADERPASIGKAIPNAEILVLREDGSPCGPNEPGELVQRGAHVAMGYWNDPDRTAERFRPLPRRAAGLVIPELAVFSGDTVRADEEGYLYFIGRRDEMIKTSGYRVSPNEIEEVVFSVDHVGECAAFGAPHQVLGQQIVVVALAAAGQALTETDIIARCKERLPIYMIPAQVVLRKSALPRNPNGKIDRKALAAEFNASPEAKAKP